MFLMSLSELGQGGHTNVGTETPELSICYLSAHAAGTAAAKPPHQTKASFMRTLRGNAPTDDE